MAIKKTTLINYILRILVLWWLPLLILFGFFFYIEFQNIIDDIKRKELTNVTLGRHALKQSLGERVSDLLTLSELFRLNYKDNRFYENQNSLFKSFIQNKNGYDHIRFINNKGDEVVRVNRLNGNIGKVQPKNLQNKRNRYYFKETLLLNKGEVYISPLDLNIEQGQIELPINPVIRLGTPVYNLKGQKQGVLIINLRGKHLMSGLSTTSRELAHSLMLLNQDGYWLLHNDPEKTWGFMYENNERFQHYYPKLWEQVINQDHGQIVNSQGIFTFHSIYPIIEAYRPQTKITSSAGGIDQHERFVWKILTHVNPQKIMDFQTNALLRFFSMAIALLGVLLMISWKLARSRMRHDKAQFALEESYAHLEKKVLERTHDLSKEIETRKKAEEQMRHMASYDNLTGIPNRALFDDRLRTVLAINKRHKKSVALMFIDLDGFKLINDIHGHHAGDQLLIQVSQRLSKQIRESDTVGRYGGDEFVVLLNEITHLGDADFIAIEIIQSLAEQFLINDFEVNIGCSIGIAIHRGEAISVKEFVKLADKAMYDVKKSGKNNFKRVLVSTEDTEVYFI